MKLSNGWYDSKEWPKESGKYYIIAIFHIKNPEDEPSLIVREGDTVIDTDYFNAEHNDWNENPIGDYDNGWEIVAWKPIEGVLLPDEYSNAVPFMELPDRPAYKDETKKKAGS